MELVDNFGVFDNPRADVKGKGEGAGDCSDNNRLGSCCGGAGGGGGDGILGLLVDCAMIPQADGVVTVMTSDGSRSKSTSMRYPVRDVLNPWMREG